MMMHERSEEMMKFIKRDMRRMIGDELIEQIENSPTPVIVRLHWEDDKFRDAWSQSISLIADLQQVEMMKVRMMELPPFEFVSHASVGHPVIEWQCDYCGQVNEISKHLECRKCGAPRKVLR